MIAVNLVSFSIFITVKYLKNGIWNNETILTTILREDSLVNWSNDIYFFVIAPLAWVWNDLKCVAVSVATAAGLAWMYKNWWSRRINKFQRFFLKRIAIKITLCHRSIIVSNSLWGFLMCQILSVLHTFYLIHSPALPWFSEVGTIINILSFQHKLTNLPDTKQLAALARSRVMSQDLMLLKLPSTVIIIWSQG